MNQVGPIYTADQITAAYQLIWSLALFWNKPPDADDWLPAVQSATEKDGVRILEHRFASETCSLVLISILPNTPPKQISWSVKGRLQHAVRKQMPAAFQRNYDLRSIGSTKRDKVEAYVASQARHHLSGNGRLAAEFSDLQISSPEVDLSQPRFSAHGRYWGNLHIGFVHDWRERETRMDVWLKVRDVLRTYSQTKGHLLSRVGIVPDHLHMTLGFGLEEAPIEVAVG